MDGWGFRAYVSGQLRRGGSLVAAVSMVAALAWAPPAAAAGITDPGRDFRLDLSRQLGCRVHVQDTTGICRTIFAFGDHQYGEALRGYRVLRGPTMAGTGTQADPFTQTVVVAVPGSGLRMEQTNSYVIGQDSFRTDVQVRNNDPLPQSGTLTAFANCPEGTCPSLEPETEGSKTLVDRQAAQAAGMKRKSDALAIRWKVSVPANETREFSWRHRLTSATASAAPVKPPVAPAVAKVPSTEITDTNGPLQRIVSSNGLQCQVKYKGYEGQWYSSTSYPANCTTSLRVGTTNYGALSAFTSFTSVTASDLTGTGTAADPYTLTTVVRAGSTGMRVTQVDTYVSGEAYYESKVTVANTSTGTAALRLGRFGDCYLAGGDSGYGGSVAVPGGTAPACLKKQLPEPGQAIRLVPLTSGSKYQEGTYSTVSSALTSSAGLNNTIVSTSVDNGEAISWDFSLLAGGSATYEFATHFVAPDAADTTIVKTANPTSVPQGGKTTYTATFDNSGPFDLELATIVEKLPAGFHYVPGSTKGFTTSDPTVTPNAAGDTVTWTGPFVMHHGMASDTFSFDATVDWNVAPASYTNPSITGTYTTAGAGYTIKPATNAASVTVTKVQQADLVTTKRATNPAPVRPGDTFTYDITVKNNGPDTATNVKISDTLPTPLTFVSSADACTASGQTLTCPTQATLANGASKTWRVTVKLDPGYTGDGSDLGNIASASSDTLDVSPSNNANTPPARPSGAVASPAADLVTSKVVLNSAPVAPGTTFDYRVTATNNGPSTAKDVKVTDDLPAALSFVSGAGCAAVGQKVTCGVEPSLAPGGSKSWTFTVKLDAGYTGDGSDLGNVAIADSTTRDPSPSNNPNPSPVKPSGAIASAVADLTTVKEALNSAPVTPGTTFEYKVTVTNNGPSVAKNVKAVDDLPAALSFVSGAGCAAVGQKVTCGVEPSLAVGASKSWTFTVKLDAGYTGDGSDLGNVAIADSSTKDPSPSNNANPSPVKPSGAVASASADLTTVKEALNSAPVTPGTTFEYKVTVTNNGPSVARDVKAVDDLPAALSFVSGAGCAAVGQKMTCGVEPSLAVGASKSWTFTVKLDAGYTGDGSDLGNVAVADSSTGDPSPSNNANPSPVKPSGAVASASADLTTVKEALNSAPVTPGTTFEYKVTITNNGPSVARDVKAVDDLPAALSFVSGAGCAAVGQKVTCGVEPSLAVGASKLWTFTVKLDAGYTGDGSDLGNVAIADSSTKDPSPSNNPNPSPVKPSGAVASASADLTTVKEALNSAPVTPGTTFEYKVTVTNNGPSVAKNIKTTDDLPAALSFVSGAGCSAVGQLVTCGVEPSLAVGASKSWTFTVKLDSGYTGDGSDLGNVAIADSSTKDPSPSNNANPSPVKPSGAVASASADLTTEKEALNSAPVTPGTTFEYKVTVTNNGPSVAKDVRATDDLPAALSFVSGAGCSAVVQLVTCGVEPSLAVGASKSWTFTVKLDAGYTGDGSDLGNVAIADSSTKDPSPSNNPNPSPVKPSGAIASASADLTTEKEALNSAPVTPGTTFEYKVTVTNNGPSVAKDIRATDDLPAALSFVSGAGCSAVGQLVTCGVEPSLAVGASKSWTFTVKLDSGYTGDGSDLGNVAIADSSTKDPSPSNNPNPSPVKPSGAIASASADLTTVKEALNSAPVTPGTTFEYKVTVTNNGPSVAKDVKALDDLPAALSFVSGGGCSAVGQKVTCGVEPSLAVGASKSWTFTVKLDAGYTGDGSDLGNVAVADSSTKDPSPSNNANPSPVKPSGAVASASADLTTVKEALNSTPVTPGTTFEYKVTVTNNGPSVAKDVKATDDLPAALSFVSGVGCSAAGQLVTCGVESSLSVGASKSWTFTVKLDSGYTGDGSDLGNVAIADSSTKDPSPSNNPNPSPVKPSGAVASASADLTTEKEALNSAPVTPGTTFEYKVTVTNNGPSVAKDVKANDGLPAALSFVAGVDCLAAGQDVTCGVEPSLAVGASKSWTFTVKLDAGYTGDGSDLGNVAVADSSTGDPSPSNNANPSPVKPSGAVASSSADLTMEKEALNSAPVTPGTTFEYKVTVTNNGPSVAKDVKALDDLPAALSFVSGAGCSAAGQLVTCGVEPSLAVGGAKSWTFTVKLDAGYTGDGSDLGNVAIADSSTKDPSPSNNPNPSPVKPSGAVASASADLTTEKEALNSAPVTPGTTFEYKVTVTNNGPSVAKDVKALDDLPAALSFVSGAGCAAVAQLVTCGVEPSLAVGASKSWTFIVKLDSGYTGDGSDLGNVAVADSSTSDPSPSNNPNPTPVKPSGAVASASADLTTEKEALNSAPVTPGTTFEYKVTVTNNGPSVAKDVKATDDLPAALSFVSGAGCAAVGQLVTCGVEASLAVGASKSWTFTVKLDPGYTGDGSDLGNVAVADSSTGDPSPSNNANPSPVKPSGAVASASADLTTEKEALNSAPVTPGTTFEYKVTVTNNGPSVAKDVKAVDDLPAALSFVSGAGCAAAGQLVTCGVEPSLAVGASKSWTFTVKLDPGYTGDGSDLGNVAIADSSTKDPSPSNNPNPSPVKPSGAIASASADLTTEKEALNSAPVTPGTTFEYKVTVTNDGPSVAKEVKATDDLPAALSFVSGVGCAAAGQLVTCGVEPSLAVGASKSWTFTVKLDSGYTGDGSDLGNVAVADSSTGDPSPSNNANPSPVMPSGAVASGSADVSTEKEALNSAPVTPGTTFEYKVTVTNNGPSAAKEVKATDDLPAALSFVSGAGCSAAGQLVTCGVEPSLANGASKSWTFTVKLDASYTGDGSDLGNVAVADSSTKDPSPSNNPNPTPVKPSGAVASASADLTTEKEALNSVPVTPGTTFEYKVTVTNNGPSVAKDVKALDDLPAALSFVSGAGCAAVAQLVTCGVEPSLAVGASKSWTFTVKLDSGYTGDGSDLGNVAVADSSTSDPSPSNNPNPTPVKPSGAVASASADLTTEKEALNSAPVTPGTTFEYKVTVTNNGPSVAKDVKALDDLPAALSFVSGAGCSAAGQLVTCGVEPSLAVGASKSWTFTVKLDSGYTGDGSDLGNVAVADSSTGDPSPSNNANPSPVKPSGAVASTSADLTTEKEALNPAPVTPGTTFEYKVTVTNNGPSVAKDVKATDDLPAALSFVSGAGCSAVGQLVTCGVESSLANSASKSWTFTVKLDPGYTGDGSDLGNVAIADSSTKDPSPSNNPNPTPVKPSGAIASASADLTTEKEALNSAPVTPGTTFEYKVTVTNNGPSVAKDVKAIDDLPAALSFVSGVDCSAVGQLVTCGVEPSLAVGASKSWTFTVKLDAGYTGDGSDLGNVAIADSSTKDPSPSNNPNPSPVKPSGAVASASADLTTEKEALNSAPVTPGTTFEYKVTVTNNGPSAAKDVKATDDLPAALSFVSGAGCSAAGQLVTCGVEPSLAVGASKSWTFTVKLDAGYTGDGSDLGNVAIADSSTKDPSPSNNPNPSPVKPSGAVASASADLTTEKEALTTEPVTPGTTFEYKVTVTNNGPSVAKDVKALDDLPAALSFVSGAGCSAAGQLVTCGVEPSLAVGASKSWTFTVKLDAGYTGDGSDLGNVAVADSSTKDPSPSNNPNPTPVKPTGVATPTAHLVMAKEVSQELVGPGDEFTYTLTATNQGPSAAVNVRTSDDLPMPITFVSSGDGCTANGQQVSCVVASLAPGASKSWTFTVKLDDGYTGDGSDLGNRATVKTDTHGSPAPTIPPVYPILKGGADVGVQIQIAERMAQRDTLTVTLHNYGPRHATNLNFDLTLPAGVVVDGPASGAVCTASGQTVHCVIPETKRQAPQGLPVRLLESLPVNRETVVTLPVRRDNTCVKVDTGAKFTVKSYHDGPDNRPENDVDDTSTVLGAGGACDDLPITGARIATYMGAGLFTLLTGIGLLMLGMRRRTVR